MDSDSGAVLSSLALVGPGPVPAAVLACLGIQDQDEAAAVAHWVVNGLWTRPEARRLGLALALAGLAKQWARRQSIDQGRLGLLTVVAFETNTAAIAFYNRLGFVAGRAASLPGQVLFHLALLLREGDGDGDRGRVRVRDRVRDGLTE